jgi:hypothetical protein
MIPGKPTNFYLKKLYLDSIDDAGNCFVIYQAELRFYIIKIFYSGLIMSDASGETYETSSLKKVREPAINELLLLFNHFLQIKGSWRRTDDPLPLFSFKYKNKELEWHCHHPQALTEIVYDEITYRGRGYAETLKLTMKPWNLPMEELRWGRFLAVGYSVIWMNWKGNNPVNNLYCNGAEYKDAVFGEDMIVFGKGANILRFKEISVIRKGKLSNIFSKMPLMKIILNKRILNTIEIKYKALSSLEINSEIAKGWSLYEIVTWGK